MNIDGELMLGESTTVFLSDDEVQLTVVSLRFARTLRLNLSTPFCLLPSRFFIAHNLQVV